MNCSCFVHSLASDCKPPEAQPTITCCVGLLEIKLKKIKPVLKRTIWLLFHVYENMYICMYTNINFIRCTYLQVLSLSWSKVIPVPSVWLAKSLK